MRVCENALIGTWRIIADMKFNIVLIGHGAWGQRYASTLLNFDNVSLTIANRDNWRKLIDQKPDGVIVCTPPSSHIEIAEYSLSRNIATMIEKPLLLSLEECIKLKQYTSPILVNHTHLFAKDYQKVKAKTISDNIKYIETIGIGNTKERDYSELWDYGPHDIAMILDLAQQMPKSIECRELYLRCFEIVMQFDKFETWSMVGFANNKDRFLMVSDGINMFNYSGTYHTNDKPLTNALNVFIDAIRGMQDYRLGLDLSLKVMEVLEQCQKSLIFQA